MIDVQTFGDRTNEVFIRPSVSIPLHAFDVELSIASVVRGPNPQPTVIGTLHVQVRKPVDLRTDVLG
jgi:hypothetical protein